MGKERLLCVFKVHSLSATSYVMTFMSFPATQRAVTMTTMTSLQLDPLLQAEGPGVASPADRLQLALFQCYTRNSC
jgi:hypothetical protein